MEPLLCVACVLLDTGDDMQCSGAKIVTIVSYVYCSYFFSGKAALDQYLVHAYAHLLLLGVRRACTFSSRSKCRVLPQNVHLCACVFDICRGVQRCACSPQLKLFFVTASARCVKRPPRFLFSCRYCFNSTLTAFKKADPPQWQKACDLLAQMKEDDSLTPSVVSYTIAIQACLGASESAAAESLVKEMVLAGFTPVEELKSLAV